MPQIYYNIDVLGVGACNLSCPSCPVGNSKDVKNPGGLMEADMLDKILAKAVAETEIDRIGLFNWTEPLLHPRLDELIRVVHSHDLLCDLSSNLNSLKGIEKVLAENPYMLRISNSGFRQENYSMTHRGGDIEVVKENMRKLMEIHRGMGCTTNIHLLYHRYRHNLDDEILMRDYCHSLGIDFIPFNAFFMPVEKVLAYVDNDPDMASITTEDQSIMDKLLVPVDEAITETRRYSHRPCILQEDQITLDFRGAVQLCCATYDSKKFTLCNYLDTPLEEIQQMKYRSSMCSRCLSHGIHVYYTSGAPELNEIALRNAPPHHKSTLEGQPTQVNA